MQVKRYKQEKSKLVEDKDGEYIKYSAFKRANALKDKLIAKLKKAVCSCCDDWDGPNPGFGD